GAAVHAARGLVARAVAGRGLADPRPSRARPPAGGRGSPARVLRPRRAPALRGNLPRLRDPAPSERLPVARRRRVPRGGVGRYWPLPGEHGWPRARRATPSGSGALRLGVPGLRLLRRRAGPAGGRSVPSRLAAEPPLGGRRFGPRRSSARVAGRLIWWLTF